MMSAEGNKTIVRQFYENVFTKGDLDLIENLVTPDFVSHVPGAPNFGPGPAGLRQLVSVYRTAFPDLRCTIEDQLAEGDKVATRITYRGTQHGNLGDVPPTGKQMTITGIEITRMSDGKMAEAWVNFDALGQLQQLGLIPQSDPVPA